MSPRQSATEQAGYGFHAPTEQTGYGFHNRRQSGQAADSAATGNAARTTRWVIDRTLGRVDLPSLALWLLIVMAALDHFSFQAGKLAVYPENIALAIVALFIVYTVVTGRAHWVWPVTTVPLAGWLAASLLSSGLNAPQRGHSLILWNKLLLVVATYLIVVNLARWRPLAAIRAQVTTAAIVSGYAVLAFAAWKLAGTHWGMEHAAGNLGQAWLPQGTLREPDILGSFAAAGALLALSLAAGAGRIRFRLIPSRRWSIWAACAVCVLAVVVSGARTAWLALAACLIVAVFLYLADRGQLLRLIPVAVLMLAVIGTIVLLRPIQHALPKFEPSQNGALIQRLASFDSLNKERDLTVREEIYQNALAHWRQSPILGWGVGAYGESFRYPPPDQVHDGWISNLPIHVLYDSGLIGLLFFAGALVLSAWSGITTWRHSRPASKALLAGLLLGLLALLLAFQATEATWFAYPWVYLGILEGIVSRRQAGFLRRVIPTSGARLPGLRPRFAKAEETCALR